MRPNSQRAKNAIIGLYFALGATILMLLLEFLTLALVSDSMAITDGFLSLYQGIAVLAGLALLGASIASAITFIQWFRRAYYNLHQLIPSSKLRYTEGWAAGAWFIPIFWWFGPYQIATDLFKNSERLLVENELMERKPLLHQVAGWWWALWIIPNILSGITRQMEKNYELLQVSTIIDILGSLLTIGGALLAIKVIKTYSPMEELLRRIPHNDNVAPVITNDDLLDSGI